MQRREFLVSTPKLRDIGQVIARKAYGYFRREPPHPPPPPPSTTAPSITDPSCIGSR